MKTNFNKIFIWILMAILAISVYSCEKEKIYSDNQPTEEFYGLMDYWYFWKDSIPSVYSNDYSNAYDLLEAMRFQPKDRWSYITTQEAFNQYYQEGNYVGYGFGYAPDETGTIRITFLFADSDFAADGVTRGWMIKEINGVSVNQDSDLTELLGADEIGVSNHLVLESPDGDIVSRSYTKKLLAMNTVLYRNVITAGAKKIGYMVFKSFIEPSIAELDEAFNYFNTENVDELIVDLRYNGGGQMNVAMYLTGLIIPDELDNQLFLKYIHNNSRKDEDFSYKLAQEPNSVRLNKVYFITSKASASASEAIINGLIPYMDVYLIGDDTYGKPVGMYSFFSNVSNLAYVPVTFKIINANGDGEYYNGLQANSYADDDITKNFGNLNEACLEEALYHIENGSFSSIKSAAEIKRRFKIEYNNLKDEIGAI
ncbi:MAG TPA: S41 family peptidase [Bacteroidales bacterium]|nr:S41 family peptidase [Bacteroidales bacterium]